MGMDRYIGVGSQGKQGRHRDVYRGRYNNRGRGVARDRGGEISGCGHQFVIN